MGLHVPRDDKKFPRKIIGMREINGHLVFDTEIGKIFLGEESNLLQFRNGIDLHQYGLVEFLFLPDKGMQKIPD